MSVAADLPFTFISKTQSETQQISAPAPATPTPRPTAANWQAWDYFNYAEALQKSIYFYDAEKCGPGITGGRLEWRGDCHVADCKVPFENSTLTESFISKYKTILDPDGDGFMDLHGGWHDAGDHVRFGLPQATTNSAMPLVKLEKNSTY